MDVSHIIAYCLLAIMAIWGKVEARKEARLRKEERADHRALVNHLHKTYRNLLVNASKENQ